MKLDAKLPLLFTLAIFPILVAGCDKKEEGSEGTESAQAAPTEGPGAGEEPAAPEEPSPAEATKEPAVEPEENIESQEDLDCDEEGVDCPLYDWMEANVQPAVENRDVKELAKVLHQIEFLAPDPSWNEGENGWAQIARAGAVLAEAGKFKEARKSCKDCHKTYPSEDSSFRAQYRERHRLRPVNELPPNADQGNPALAGGAT